MQEVTQQAIGGSKESEVANSEIATGEMMSEIVTGELANSETSKNLSRYVTTSLCRYILRHYVTVSPI